MFVCTSTYVLKVLIESIQVRAEKLVDVLVDYLLLNRNEFVKRIGYRIQMRLELIMNDVQVITTS